MSGAPGFGGFTSSVVKNVALASALAKCSALLRLDKSTPVSGEWTSIVDVLNSNPAVQASALRRPAADLSELRLPVATFDGTDLLRWTLTAQNNSTAAWEIMFWFMPASVGSGQALHYVTSPSLSGSADISRHRLNVFPGGKVNWDIFSVALNGRSYTSTVATLVPSTRTFIRAAWNAARTNECDTNGTTVDAKVRIYLDGNSIALTPTNIGSGGPPTALLSATGDALIGASNDADAPLLPILNGGQIGPFIAVSSTPLTEPEGRAMMDFLRPKA